MYKLSNFNNSIIDRVLYTAYGASDALSASMPELGLVSQDFIQALLAYAQRHDFARGSQMIETSEIVREVVNQRRNQVAAENVAKLEKRQPEVCAFCGAGIAMAPNGEYYHLDVNWSLNTHVHPAMKA